MEAGKSVLGSLYSVSGWSWSEAIKLLLYDPFKYNPPDKFFKVVTYLLGFRPQSKEIKF
jgi:hypothetical protein